MQRQKRSHTESDHARDHHTATAKPLERLRGAIGGARQRLLDLATPRARREALHAYWRNPHDGRNRPEDYAERHARSRLLVDLVTAHAPAPPAEARVLEVGCNAGRNLHHLHRAGYRRLEAIEISARAVEVFRERFPAAARHTRVTVAPAEDALGNLEEGAYDVVFTMAVLEHLHPDSAFVFDELARVTGGVLITVEDEAGVSPRHFPRNYRRVFEPLGLRQVHARECGPDEGLPPSFRARVFEPAP